jgi:DNA-binding GntR family transcriptional regulator
MLYAAHPYLSSSADQGYLDRPREMGHIRGILYTTAQKVPLSMSSSDGSRTANARLLGESQQEGAASPRVAVEPIVGPASFKNRAYAALKDVIVSMDVYRSRSDVRLDERRLAQDFGISRTPVREAMAQLEREGFVRSVPRRGIYVVRKTKREVIEMITAWAALESMAARLITEQASDEDIASLRKMFTKFENGELHARLDEYSEVNIEFHQGIIRMSRNSVLISLAENLFTHMRMIRMKTIGERDRADRSIHDHMHIIEALEARDTARAEELVRSHALGLADHVAKYAGYLD